PGAVSRRVIEGGQAAAEADGGDVEVAAGGAEDRLHGVVADDAAGLRRPHAVARRVQHVANVARSVDVGGRGGEQVVGGRLGAERLERVEAGAVGGRVQDAVDRHGAGDGEVEVALGG